MDCSCKGAGGLTCPAEEIQSQLVEAVLLQRLARRAEPVLIPA